MTSRLIALSVACLLTGCGHLTTCAARAPLPPFPVNLTAECPPLMPLRSPLLPALGASMARDSLMYNDCAARHKALAELAKTRGCSCE